MATVDILFQGFPGWSPTHGRIAWPSLAIVNSGGKRLLLDTGHIGIHRMLLAKLEERGISRNDIDVLAFSHSHWDHSLGWTLFPNARLVIGKRELNWATGLKLGENLSVPPFLMHHLAEDPRLETVEDGAEILPGVTMIDTPGHTPGHMSMVVETDEGITVLAQDAVKNRAEFLARRADQTMDAKASSASICRVASIAQTVVPGHDRAFRVEGDRAVYIGELRAEILAQISPDMEEQTVFSIVLR